VCALAALGLAGAGTAGGRAVAERSRLGDEIDPLFFAGDRVEGHPLVAVLRRSGDVEFVSFVYGDCAPLDDTGCAPPVEVQVWPACRRSIALYDSSPVGLDLERTTVRGVPGAVLDGGTRLELQTGRSTVVVFADSRARLTRIAGSLRPLDGGAGRGSALPAPAAGAVEGRLAC
jgi:hypothetical protein